MALKATLKIRLLADDVLVAESENETLWRQVLAAMQQDSVLPLDAPAEGPNASGTRHGQKGEPRNLSGDSISRFASEIGVSATDVQGACDPRTAEPFIHLDAKLWEAFKKNTPARGPKSIAAVKLSATLLCLWFKAAGIKARPTLSQALAVLDGIGASDRNPSRSIANCEWLQSRSDGVQLNPARHSMATAVAKAYCTGSPVDPADQ